MSRVSLKMIGISIGLLGGDFAGAGMAADLVIDRMPAQIDSGSAPSQFVTINDMLYFTARGSSKNTELWRTDGTNAGTHVVREIDPRGTQWDLKSGSDPLNLFNWNGTLYFTAVTPETGRELWKSDGTNAGTVMVKDTTPGPKAGIVFDPHFVVYRNELYFIANRGLFKTDGTPEGTVQLGKDDGPTSPLSSVADVEVAGDYLYFHSKGSYGPGIWRFDDGPVKLIQVLEILDWTGTPELTNAGGTLYCAIDRNKALAKVGTTTHSSVLLTDTMDRVSSFTEFDGKLVFTARRLGSERSGIWMSDGTPAGTIPLLEPADVGIGGPLTIVNGLLIFNATASNGSGSIGLSDGTVAGTHLVVSSPQGEYFTWFNGELYYMTDIVRSGDHYPVMYKTNGTQQGTMRVDENMYTGDAGFGILGDRLFFGGRTQGWGGIPELWSIPVTTGMPSLFQKLGVEGEPGIDSGDVGVAFKGKYYFTDRSKIPGKSRSGISVTNGSAAGTAFYSDNPSHLVGSVNGHLFITDDYESVLSSASGVTGDEESLGMKYSTYLNGGLAAFVPWGNRALIRGNSVYVTDGTASGSIQLFSSSQSSFRWDMTPLNDSIAVLRKQDYSIYSGEIGYSKQLWATDGSVAGTVKITDLRDDPDIGAVMVSSSGYGYMPVYTDRDNGQGPAKLWKTNGTQVGTSEISGSPDFYNVESIKANSSHVLFASVDPETGTSVLWSYDIVGNSFTNLQTVFPTGSAVVFNDLIYFAGNDGVHGVELWQSDGTVGGTFMVDDFMPGSNSSFPTQLTVIQDILFLAMDHPEFGYELFAMRQTDTKPWMVDDLNSGRAPSTPNRLHVSTDGNTLFMFADNGASGQELFKVDVNGLMPYTAARDWSLYQ